MDPITGLALGRCVIGATSFVSPALGARMLLLDKDEGGQTGYVTRMFAARELALGALTLAASGKDRRRLVTVGIAVDGADALTALAGLFSGKVPKKSALALGVVAGAAVATGYAGLDEV